ncbi:hypothetical protein ACFY0N_38755 [Streptomyces vinaceus]|uniref:hypothetical protein n=1 Tax=Streptomyces vinaceus TaxID=1960 RepID=UPI0036B35462
MGAHSHLRMRAADGTWAKVSTILLAPAGAEGELDCVVTVEKGPWPATRPTMPSGG